jgi:hypothetical protein
VVLLCNAKRNFPMDWATGIIELIFEVLEIIFCAIAMVNVSNKQTAVYYLRNSQALIVNKEERIKTSAEIEEELYIKFPQLKQKMQKKKRGVGSHVE